MCACVRVNAHVHIYEGEGSNTFGSVYPYAFPYESIQGHAFLFYLFVRPFVCMYLFLPSNRFIPAGLLDADIHRAAALAGSTFADTPCHRHSLRSPVDPCANTPCHRHEAVLNYLQKKNRLNLRRKDMKTPIRIVAPVRSTFRAGFAKPKVSGRSTCRLCHRTYATRRASR